MRVHVFVVGGAQACLHLGDHAAVHYSLRYHTPRLGGLHMGQRLPLRPQDPRHVGEEDQRAGA